MFSEVPLHNPDEAEEQVGDGDQQVRQRQIVGGVWKVDFVRLVVAVKKVGLLQEALQVENTKWVRAPDANLIFLPPKMRSVRTYSSWQQICNVLMEDDQPATGTARVHAAQTSCNKSRIPF